VLFLEPIPSPRLSPPPSDSKPAEPKTDESTLLLPRLDGPSLPSSTADAKIGTIVEEPVPLPHKQSAGPIPILAPQPFREEAAPRPHAQIPPPPARPGAPRDPSLPDVESLHRETESLRLERESMLAEKTDLLTAKDFHAAKSTEAHLQKRIAELLVRVAQQTKKANEMATAASPQRVASEKSRAEAKASPPPAILQPSPSTPPSAPPAQPPTPPSPTASVKQPDDTPKGVTDAPVDPLALAQSLYRTGNFAEALNAYHKLDKDDQKPEERVAIQYMIACCLRKLGKVDEASTLYREVANTPGNDFLSENAQWHLRTMKERHELEAQLEELRQRHQALKSRKL
jgi:tetratricopeptide (TPR) repeat protein